MLAKTRIFYSMEDKINKPDFNPLNAELNPICHLLALLGAHHILHISRIRVNNGVINYCENYNSISVTDDGYKIFLIIKLRQFYTYSLKERSDFRKGQNRYKFYTCLL